MVRRRRSPEQARIEILDAAERLLLAEGPAAIKVARVAKEAGMSHPGLLHHFGSADALTAALHTRLSLSIREDLLGLLAGGSDRAQAFDVAAARLADPTKGRLLAWVIASGASPFPPAKERGLEAVADILTADQAQYRVLLVVLAMFGESLLGSEVRARLGMGEEDPAEFRRWLMRLVSRPGPGT